MSVPFWLLTLLSLSMVISATEEPGAEEFAMEKVRGLLHGLKKTLKKHLVPALLIAYKMKALLGFVGMTMSLSALGTATGLAGLFFALFAVAICTVVENEHRHRRLERRYDEDDMEVPRVLRALEAI